MRGPFSHLCIAGFKEEKINKVILDGKYIASYPSTAFLKPIMN